MNSLKTPLELNGGRLSTIDDLKESVDQSIDMFINTPKGSLVADKDYGFVFAGLRFEIFDDSNGTVYNSFKDDDPVYHKKISGSSNNLDTFASDLCMSLTQYEPRLKNIKASMQYDKVRSVIRLSIHGNFAADGGAYEYNTEIKIWC